MSSELARYEAKTPPKTVMTTRYPMVCLLRRTMPMARRRPPTLISMRLAGSSVSGRRRPQIATANRNRTQNQNAHLHGAIAMIPAPTAGATIGTTMNTAKMNDMTRAMRSPS